MWFVNSLGHRYQTILQTTQILIAFKQYRKGVQTTLRTLTMHDIYIYQLPFISTAALHVS